MDLVEVVWAGSSELSLVDRLHAVSCHIQSSGQDLNASFRKVFKDCNDRLEQLRGYSSKIKVAQFDELKKINFTAS